MHSIVYTLHYILTYIIFIFVINNTIIMICFTFHQILISFIKFPIILNQLSKLNTSNIIQTFPIFFWVKILIAWYLK